MSHRRELTLYSRPNCHLCDVMKAQIDRLRARVALDLQVVNITGDIGLERRYGNEIPVLLINGRKAVTVSVDDVELIRILEETFVPE